MTKRTSAARPFYIHSLPSAAVTVLLAACGGGGGGNDSSGGSNAVVPLSSRADVARETSNLIELAVYRLGVDPAPTPPPSPVAATSEVAVEGKAVRECARGGTIDSQESIEDYRFKLYPEAGVRSVFTESDVTVNCREPAAGFASEYTQIFNGSYKDGVTEPDAFGTRARFTLLGAAGIPWLEVIEGPDYRQAFSQLGIWEGYDNTLGGERRYVLTEEYDDPGAPVGFLKLGRDDDPFNFFYLDGPAESPGRTYRFDGPLAYSSSDCVGGEIDVSTGDVGMRFADDDVSTFPTSGNVTLSSGTTSVDVSFQPDGSAIFQVRGGISGTLTRQEVRGSPCQLLPPRTE